MRFVALRFTTSRRVSSIRDCQPSPVNLKYSITSGLMRSDTSLRFLYLQRLAFGGKVAGRNFGVDTNGPSRFDVTKRKHPIRAGG